MTTPSEQLSQSVSTALLQNQCEQQLATTSINSSIPRPDPPQLTTTQLQDLDQVHPEYRHLLLAEIEADRVQLESRASISNPNSPQLLPTSQRPQPELSGDSIEPCPVRIQLTVWDNEEEEDEDEEEDNRDLLPVRISNNPMMQPMARTEEVYAQLNVLFARWEPTAPSTVKTTVVRYVDNLRLGIYLETAMNNNGLTELRDQTIPSAIELLTSILWDLTTTTTFTETANNDRDGNDEPESQTQFVEGRHMYIMDNQGTRIQLAEFDGEWILREVVSLNLEVRA
uniref:Uncharacterized protein n=1 Tax=Moniliophthora roreri TaxID=221103 RepID=A0A0W0FR63_MONRR